MADDPLPFDFEVVRKARVNDSITRLCSKSISPSNHLTLIGTGLYTHVAQRKGLVKDHNSTTADNKAFELHFLPLGGFKGTESSISRQSDKEVAAVYKELQEAVEAEAKAWKDHKAAAHNNTESTLDALTKKYGDLYHKAPATLKPSLVIRNNSKRKHSKIMGDNGIEPAQKRTASFAPLPEPTRMNNNNVSKTSINTDLVRRGSGSGNMYDRDRDPRHRLR